MDLRLAWRLRRRHSRAARGFAQAAFFHAEIRQRLLERLDWVRLAPRHILDLGAGPAAAAEALLARYPGAAVIALDHAAAMLHEAPRVAGLARVCGAAEQLPLGEASVELVFSNLMLAYCRDPQPVLAEARRVLASPGLFSLATLGRGSFAELRAAWQAADEYVHCPPLPDMHDLGDLLVRAGFAEPVLDTETLTIRYRDPQTLFADLRAAGVSNHSQQRNPGLTGRAAAQRLRAALAAGRDAGGRLPLTMEVVYAQAWAGPTAAGRRESHVPLSAIRRRRPFK